MVSKTAALPRRHSGKQSSRAGQRPVAVLAALHHALPLMFQGGAVQLTAVALRIPAQRSPRTAAHNGGVRACVRLGYSRMLPLLLLLPHASTTGAKRVCLPLPGSVRIQHCPCAIPYPINNLLHSRNGTQLCHLYPHYTTHRLNTGTYIKQQLN